MISQRERGELARFYTVTEPKKHQRGYTVYKVTARIISRKNPEDVQEITVWKRYSDFRKLHQNLWHLHKNLCSQSELFPPFAKAKVFGRFDGSVIEERRQCSEDLLQFSANIPALYSSQHIQDFFQGGEVHDGSELIGPPEPSSDFLADSLSDCSSEVQRDISGADDLTVTSEYGGLSSDSDLTSLAVDTDSLAELDDGMASGRTSPNQPPGGAAASSSVSAGCSPLLSSLRARRSPSPAPPPPGSPGSPASNPELGKPGRTALFSGALKRAAAGVNAKEAKPDYLDKAGEHIRLAAQKEAELDYPSAFSYYRSGVDLLLQGVQGEPSPTRREAVKKKTAEYLMRAELISSQHLKSSMGQTSTQSAAMAAQCCPPTSRGGQQNPAEELRAYSVLGIVDKVLLVMDKRTQETFILKGLRKSSECGRSKQTIMPHSVPNMVRLRKFIVSEDAIFLLLQYAEGGKLWSHIGKFLRSSSPEDSFDIPFIQKSHTNAVHSAQHTAPRPDADSLANSGSGHGPGSVSGSGLQKLGNTLLTLAQKSGLHPGFLDSLRAPSDSGAASEEECTNSYLTLCNEYEQEKVEPDALEEERTRREAAPDAPLSATAATSSRTRSLLSNDSLTSPISSQELSFFTDPSAGRGHDNHNTNGQDNGEVFSPLPSPAPPLSLDQSKRTPMEFFRIDSKDSASEVTCADASESRPSPKPQVPLFSTSDLGSEEVTEDPMELALEVKGHGVELWGLDGSDKGSNESVPVISFKEAVVEDEGHPPDLLVNLPVMGGAVGALDNGLGSSGVCLGLEATASPRKFTKPDVLQLHEQPGEEREQEEAELTLEQGLPLVCTVSAPSEISQSSSSPCTSLWDDCSLVFGQEAVDKTAVDPTCQSKGSPPCNIVTVAPPSNTDVPVACSFDEKLKRSSGLNTDSVIPDPSGSGASSNPAADGRGMERPPGLGDSETCRNTDPNAGGCDRDVSRLFAELDELSLAAAQACIPEEFVRRWAVEMVAALDRLHQEGVVCRDLNPNNILLNHQGHVQLTYFCSWSEVEESCDREAITNMYCAPEVGGIGEETAACDWWSLGAILFELLTGKSLLQCHPAGISRHTALNIPESVSEEAASLLEQLLQYNPMERLGAGAGGADDVKSHPFFARAEWPTQ